MDFFKSWSDQKNENGFWIQRKNYLKISYYIFDVEKKSQTSAVNKEKRTCRIENFVVPADHRGEIKENKYTKTLLET